MKNPLFLIFLLMSQLIFAETDLSELSCDINKVQSKDWSEDMLGYQQDNYQEIFPVWLSKAESGDPKYQFYLAKAYSFGNGTDKDLKKSLFWYEQSSEHDYPIAKNNLALMYETGQGVEQDFNKSFQLICDAAIQGLHVSQYNIGRYYKFGIDREVDYSKAIDWFNKAQESGNSSAVYELGVMHYRGERFKKDDKKAFYLIEIAAENLILSAIYDMGLMHMDGVGTDRDIDKAIKWFKNGLKNKSYLSGQALYVIYSDKQGDYYDQKLAIKYLKISAELGGGYASYSLGEIYRYGKDGVKINYKDAFYWYLKGAEQGDLDAQGGLSTMYAGGFGTDIDYSSAFYWAKESSNQGSLLGKLQLAILYATGLGVDQDFKTAKKYYDEISKSDNDFLVKDAIRRTAELYRFGQGVNKSPSTAVTWYEKAANLGDSASQNELGHMYSNGIGVDTNQSVALYWFRKSAAQGNREAQNNLGAAYMNGSGVEKDYQEALYWINLAIKNNSIIAIRNLGVLYHQGWGVEKNIDKAMELYKNAAELGDNSAMMSLGLAFFYGSGKGIDKEESFKWYLMAANDGNVQAQKQVAIMYLNGDGINIDIKKHVFWLEKALDGGINDNEVSQAIANAYLYGLGVDRNFNKAWKIDSIYVSDKVISSTDPDIQLLLDTANDFEFYVKDYKRAEIWYKKAANKGSSEACIRLGHFYSIIHSLRGFELDTAKAEFWYKKGIDLGNIEAKAFLGWMYITPNISKAEDRKKGIKLLQNSREEGSIEAPGYLSYVYEFGVGVDVDVKKAIDLSKEELKLTKSSDEYKEYLLLKIFKKQVEYNLMSDDITSTAMQKLIDKAKNGDTKRQLDLAQVYLSNNFKYRNIEEGVYWLNKASSKSIKANLTLAEKYFGASGFEFNYSKYGEHLIKAVDLFESSKATDYQIYLNDIFRDTLADLYQDVANYFSVLGMPEVSELFLRKSTLYFDVYGNNKFAVIHKILLLTISQDKSAEAYLKKYIETFSKGKGKGKDSWESYETLFSVIIALQDVYDTNKEYKKSAEFLSGVVAMFNNKNGIHYKPFLLLEAARMYAHAGDYSNASSFIAKYKEVKIVYKDLVGINVLEDLLENVVISFIDIENGNVDEAIRSLTVALDGIIQHEIPITPGDLDFSTKSLELLVEKNRSKEAFLLMNKVVNLYKDSVIDRISNNVKIPAKEKALIKNGISNYLNIAKLSDTKLNGLGFEEMQLASGLTASEGIIKTIIRSYMGGTLAVKSKELDRLISDRRALIESKFSVLNDIVKFTNVNNKLNKIDKEIDLLDKEIKNEVGSSKILSKFIVSYEDIQNAILEKDALITMLVSDNRSYVWLVTKNGIYKSESNLTTSQIEEHAIKLQKALDPKSNSKFPVVSASVLYDFLILPFKDKLEDIDRIIFSPDSYLSNIPFSILMDDKRSTSIQSKNIESITTLRGVGSIHKITVEQYNNNWLLNEFAISIVPSVYSYLELAKYKNKKIQHKAEGSFIGIGNPVLSGSSNTINGGKLASYGDVRGSISRSLADLSPLPDTEDELREISLFFNNSKIVTQNEATERKIRNMDLSRFQVVSFATHALVSNEINNILEPSLVLTPVDSNNPNNDGLLTTSEVSELDLDADIVLLSACNTASSFGESNSQGLSGLANSFFNAGAKSLLVSYWSVISESAVDITTRIFKPSNNGRSYAHKHRNAVLDLLQNSKDIYKLHPSYWAPFAVIGVN